MAEKIKKEDLFDSQLFSEVLPGLEKYVQLLDKAEKEAVEFLKVQRDIANVRGFNNSADVEAQAKAEKSLGEAIKQGTALRKENIEAQTRLAAIKAKARQGIKDEIALEEAAKDSLVAKRIELKKLIAEYDKGTSATRDKLRPEINKLTKDLNSGEQATGRYQRQVGNYHNSLNKLSKGLKGFGGLGKLAAKAFGFDTEIIDTIKETGKAVKEFAHAEELLTTATEGHVTAVEEEIIVEKEQSAFANVSLGVWGLVAAAIGLAVYGIYQWSKGIEDSTRAWINNNETIKTSKENVIKLNAEIAKTNIAIAVQNEKLTELQGKKALLDLDFQEKLTGAVKRARDERKKIIEEETSFTKKAITAIKNFIVPGLGTAEAAAETAIKVAAVDKQLGEELKKEEEKNDSEINLDKAEKARDRRDKEKDAQFKFLKDLHEVQRTENNAADQDVADSQKKVQELNVDATKATIQNISDLQKQQLDDLKKANQMIEDNEKANAEKRKKRQKEIEDLTISQVEKSLDRQNALKSSALDQELQQRERNIQQQQSLAERGLDNQLAFEQAQLAKAELAKAELAKKELKQKEALAFMKLIADDGFAKGSIEFAFAKAVTAKDGVEDLEGPGTETSDSIPAWLSKGESVATASATRENPGLVTAMNKGKVEEYFKNELLPGYMTETGINTGSFARNVANSAMIHELVSVKEEIKGLKQVIQARPVHQSEITKAGDVIETKIANGLRTVILHKTAKKPL